MVVDWETAGMTVELFDVASYFATSPSTDCANIRMYGNCCLSDSSSFCFGLKCSYICSISQRLEMIRCTTYRIIAL